jgi:hypothetical protein
MLCLRYDFPAEWAAFVNGAANFAATLIRPSLPLDSPRRAEADHRRADAATPKGTAVSDRLCGRSTLLDMTCPFRNPCPVCLMLKRGLKATPSRPC